VTYRMRSLASTPRARVAFASTWLRVVCLTRRALVNHHVPPSESRFTTNQVTFTAPRRTGPGRDGVTHVSVQLTMTAARGQRHGETGPFPDLPPGECGHRGSRIDLAGNLSLPSVVVVRYTMAINDDFTDASGVGRLGGAR